MKIAVLSCHTPSLFWFRMDMMRAFLAKGHQVIAVGDQKEIDWKDRFLEQGIQYRQARLQRNGTNPLKDLESFLSLRTILHQERPDCVFTYQAKTVIYGALAANSLGITEVYPLIAGVGSVFLADGIKAKLLRTILCLEYRAALHKCPGVFFQNRDDVQVFKENGILHGQKITMLRGSGVNLERFRRCELPERFGILCVARLIRDKGVMEYLEACRILRTRYPDLRCMLVGPYDTNHSAITQEELQTYLEDGSVEYFGEQEDVLPFLQQCTVFVLPSYREGTPKSILEAMAVGRAVVTTDAPGCRETVRHGENGLLVPVKDSDALVEAVDRLYHHPQQLREMAKKSRQMAEERFDVRIVNQTIMETMKL